MSRDPKKPNIAEVESAAAVWLARRDRGLSAAEQDEYLQWLAVDASHGKVMARLQNTWKALDAIAQWRPSDSPQPNPDLLLVPARFKIGRRRWLFAAAAAAAVLAFAVWKPLTSALAPSIHIEGSGLHRLSDGSLVKLDREAAISVQFTSDERRVQLARGEAEFNVAKDPARPFAVYAGKLAVHAVGTVFNVRMQPGLLEVVVSEGKVHVNEPRDPLRSVLDVPLLVAGQKAVIFSDRTALRAVVMDSASTELDPNASPQDELLFFTYTPLAEAVAEFNRWNQRKLVLADAATGEIRVGGSFRASNVGAFVRLLEAGFGVTAERKSETEIVLRRAER